MILNGCTMNLCQIHYPRHLGIKQVYLKNKLLDNLNNFFPNPDETLEIFGPRENMPSPPIPETNSVIEPMPIPMTRERIFPHSQNPAQNSLDHNPFPTLIPTEASVSMSDPPGAILPPPPPPPTTKKSVNTSSVAPIQLFNTAD
ncbi:unnamed protein product [Strongylus vulgaris]|uniref:Uncharacterized protein n=1 Tax=Strongylus vulgaris TaxID=40348 RepID=A0A3P7IIC7_STRVU|nr:unnamed protein product [Strongylus vulgaris]